MRKLVLFLHSSLDGIVEGPNGAMDIGFVAYDNDLEKETKHILSTVDTVIWGRGTYEGMYSYWPTIRTNPESTDYEKNHLEWIENVEKVVFSRTLDQVNWKNSHLVKEDLSGEIRRMKELPGQDMLILGSPRLAHELMKYNLIDEYKLTISPVIVGQGLKLFKNFEHQENLKLVRSKVLASGALSLDYKVIRD